MENLVGREGYEANFWKGKKVFITGHTGFKGAWLSAWLIKLGSRVKGYALRPELDNALFYQLELANSCESILADINDYQSLEQEIVEFQPEIVMHLAAKAMVLDGFANPVETFSTNINGVINLLEIARGCKSVKAIINVTSDKCYRNLNTGDLFTEDDALGGQCPYSASKACSEIVTASYSSSFYDHSKVGVATARAGNVIGGRDYSGRIVPDAIQATMEGASLNLRNPQAIRPWQHVLEPVWGYLKLAERLYWRPSTFSGAWNFGPPNEDCITVREVASIIGSKSATQLKIVCEPLPNLPTEANVLRLDSKKARDLLGWQTQLSIDKAIEMTVQWHESVETFGSAYAITHEQISNYEKLIGLVK